MAVEVESQADLELDPGTDATDVDAMIEVRDLTHYYGPMPAVENVNFKVRRGEILGFLGPNGAGKTTTMRILTGFMPPTRGTVTLDGFDVVEKSLEVRKRVGIAQAILHEPEVLVLDEPTIGIDPIQVVETRSLIQDLGREQTVVLSSHILPEVSMICERVLIIHEGHIVAADTPNNLAQHLRGVAQLEVEIGGPPADVLPVLRNIDGTTEVTHHPRPGVNAYRVKFREGLDLRDDISRTVVSNGWSLLSMQMSSMSLEEIFLRVTTAEDDVE